jgi:hypothetical protein
MTAWRTIFVVVLWLSFGHVGWAIDATDVPPEAPADSVKRLGTGPSKTRFLSACYDTTAPVLYRFHQLFGFFRCISSTVKRYIHQ